ncbi:MAG: hypothetical protein A2X12_02995 [Bacteroidetes bacterium GWE2_29_8]|nr:MAG: hypothetical protein A2X12_02995 [Bacteroidetes bacterium GWE2_29_8]OFY19270.1 MAG: hypothetical protein A2X02_02095 [Bacteroidetes bacterium GWF2_29_10]
MINIDIQKRVEINKNTILVNGIESFSYTENNDFNLFIKSIYKSLNINYPKFYKMSNLCKLGFIASEVLLKDINLTSIDKNKVGVILSNFSSSLQIDIEYQNTIKNIPSPGVFVYTLPNIITGEICIRNGFRGEELFLIQKNFNKEFIFNYVENLFIEGNTTLCISGWVEFDSLGIYHADLYLLKKITLK